MVGLFSFPDPAMAIDLTSVSSTIENIVDAESPVLGSLLSAKLKERVPDWDPAIFQVRSLRAFIEKYIPTVDVVGRAGMDVIYAVKGSTAASTTKNVDSFGGNPWRAWMSPNGPHALAIDKSGCQIRLVPRGTTVSDGEILVLPASSQVHLEAARSFLSQLPDPVQAELKPIVERAADDWWQEWMGKLRGTAYLADWSTFRHKQLEICLIRRLQSDGMSETSADRVLRLIQEQSAANRASKNPPAMRKNITADDAFLRQVVLAAIQDMTAAELRDLRLPLGRVLDALAAKGRV